MRAVLVATVGVLLALQSAAQGQEAEKFVGTWFAPNIADRIDQSMTISHDGGVWQIRSTFSKAGKNVGSSVGTDVNLSGGTLLFVGKFVEKPVKSWKGTTNVQGLRFKGNDLEMFDGARIVRTFKRTSPEPMAVAKVEPKVEPKAEPKVEPKVEPKMEPKPAPADVAPKAKLEDYAGVWKGTTVGLAKHTFVLKISADVKELSIEGFSVSSRGKLDGHFAPKTVSMMPGASSGPELNTVWEAFPGSTMTGPIRWILERTKDELRISQEKRVKLKPTLAPYAVLTVADVSELEKLPTMPKIETAKLPDPSKRPDDKSPIPPTKKTPVKVPVIEPESPIPYKTWAEASALSGDRSRLALAEALDRGVKPSLSVFDMATRMPLWSIETPGSHLGQGVSLAFSPNGKWIAFDDHAIEPRLRVLDAATGKEVTYPAPLRGTGRGQLAFHPTEPLLAFQHYDRENADRNISRKLQGNLALLDVKTGKIKWSVDAPLAHHVVFDPSGKYIATTGRSTEAFSQRRQMILFEAATGKVAHSFPPCEAEIEAIAFSPDGKRLYYVEDLKRGRLSVVDVETKESIRQVENVGSQNGALGGMFFFPDGKTFALIGQNFVVRLIDAESCKTKSAIRCKSLPRFASPLDEDRILIVCERQAGIYHMADATPIPGSEPMSPDPSSLKTD